MKKHLFYGAAALAGITLIASQTDRLATVYASEDAQVTPIVFQAAGPTIGSIQSMVDTFRAALGTNNGNVAGPIAEGRREINWDGGGSTLTAPAPTPFDGFLLNRGARFTTPGSGFVQAPLDGLVATFLNESYGASFQAFSPTRLFSAIDSRITGVHFFVPGGGEQTAATAAFGAIFSDVDTSRSGDGQEPAPTTMTFYDERGRVLHTADVPASRGDGSLSFLGVQFDRARIAAVRIASGSVAPGRNDSLARDIVMMDDFIYAEPQAVELAHGAYSAGDDK